MKKLKKLIELRHYDLPPNNYVLPLIGDTWKRLYECEYDHYHFHNLLEIGYCHFGDGELLFDDGTIRRYSHGTITVIPKNVPHNTKGTPQKIDYWEYLFINCEAIISETYRENESLAQKLITRLSDYPLVSQEQEHPILAEAILTIIREYKSEQLEFRPEIVQSRMVSLLLEAARVMPTRPAVIEPEIKKKHEILNSMEYIQKHYTEEIKIKDLADLCFISETHFRRCFQEILHMTPVDYINFVRIQSSCELLSSTRESINHIASKVGFPTVSSFNRNFKTILGIQPRQWRLISENYKSKLLDYKISALKGWE